MRGMRKIPKHISDKQLYADEARKDRRAQYFVGACTLLGALIAALPQLMQYLG